MLLNSKNLTEEELVWLMEYLKKEDISELEAISLSRFNSDIEKVAFNIDSAKSQDLLKKIHASTGISKSDRYKLFLPALKVAALLLVSLTIGIYFKSAETETINKKVSRVKTAVNEPTLTLGDGTEIVLSEKSGRVLINSEDLAIRQNAKGQLVYQVSKKSAHKPALASTEYNKISTPLASQYQILLADGTKVLLNSASSIRFPTIFNGNERRVEISGEVYFEVAKDKRKPFKVVCGSQTVEVLGTHFNVNAYSNESSIKTTLLEGSVKVLKGNSSVLLKPGQQAQTDATINVVENPDIQSEISWTTGSFYFKDADIQTVMRQASRWYDVEVKYKGAIPRKQFNGTISQKVPLTQFLAMLKFAGLNCTESGNSITITQ